MTRDQYIDSLIDQGLPKEDINKKLSEFDLQTDPPKKTADPLKQETSMGSSNMVSNLEDGFSASSIDNIDSIESKEEKQPEPKTEVSKEVFLPGLEEYPGLEKMLTSGEFSKSELANMGLIIDEEGEVEVEKIEPVDIKVKKRPSNLTEVKTFGERFKAGALQIESDILKIPAFANRVNMAIRRLFMTDEQKEGFDKLSSKAQDVYAQAIGLTPSIEASKKAKELDSEIEEIQKGLPQYTEGIVEDFQIGNYSRGFARSFSNIAGILPSVGEAFLPFGLPLIGFQSAASASEEAIKEGKKIDAGLIAYSATRGASEALLEITTRKLGKSLFKSLYGKPRATIKNNLIEIFKEAPKEGLKEGVSEDATEFINKLADDIYLGKDFKLSESWGEFADIFYLSFLTGGGAKVSANAIEISKSVTENRIVNRVVSKTNYDSVSDAFISEASDLESIDIAKNKYTENVLKNELQIKEKLGEITEQESKDIQANFNKTKAAVNVSEKLGIEKELSEETVSLIKERADINQRVQDAGDNKAIVSDDINRLKEVDERLAQIGVENKTLKTTKNVAKIVEGIDNVEIITAENTEEANAIAEEQDIDKKASFEQGYIVQRSDGKQTIVINKEVANKDQAVNVASHELLHAVLFKTVGENQEIAKSLAASLEKEIEKINPSILEQSEFKDRLSRYSSDAKPEETLTLFADAVATGEIEFEESLFQKIGGSIRRVLQSVGFTKINFNNSNDVFNFIKDYNKSVTKGRFTKAQSELLKQTAEGRLVAEPAIEETKTTVKESKAKATVLEEINNLLPESIQTKEQFLSDRSFTKVYESAMNPGGAINNYIKSRTSSAMEAELAVDSVLERLMNFDPEAKRKDGSTIGREGFGEFIFANTAFGKLDAKKKLFQESERRSKETSIDESTKQIADVETVVEEEIETKQKPKINPLKFTGVPDGIKLSDKPGKGLTFKKVAKQYAGEVGEQAIGIPAKKITESAANLGSVNEARAIQQFFFKADNLDKFVKILPETNIALPETEIGIETLDVSKEVQGTGLGLSKRILDYFYEDFIDPTGKLTSPKGRSKGLTSQTAVKRLKPEFRGTVSKETIDKVKKDIGITPKGELNILPKGELRSPIGQLLKGMAKTYSTLAANTLVRQEMEATGATKQEVADVAAGKTRVMLSKQSVNESKNVFMQDDSFVKSSDEFAAENKVWKAILKPLNLELPSSKDPIDVENFRQFVKSELTKVLPKSFFTGGTFANAGSSAAKRGFFFVSKEDLNSVIDGMEFANEDADITSAVNRESYKNLESKINDTEFRNRQDQSIEGLRKTFKAFEALINENPENTKYVAALLSSSSQGMAHFIRTSAPITFYSKVLDGKVEEHTLPASLVGKYLFNSILNGTLDSDFENIRKNYQQGLLSKVDDKKLKGFKPNGKPYNYIASTPEGWKITDNIFGRYFNENVANNNGGIDPNNIVLYNGNTIVEEYGINSKGFATTVGIENESKKAFKNNSKIMFSKATNNSELLNNLKNRDAAIRNARNIKAPIKGISVFDFDDTLATTKSMVGVTMSDGTKTKIDATEFAKRGDDLLKQGAEFDFSDFSKVVDGKPGPLISKLEKAIKKFGNKDVFVLTARPANSASAIYEFLKGLGYEIPLENITGLANSSPEAKAQWMVNKAAEGYNDFYFTDDAYKNVKAVQDAMKVLDVKSKERIVYKDIYDKMDKEMNDILEAKSGIASEKVYSKAKAEVVGSSQGKFKWFIPPSADDFVGLLYSTLAKGKLGDNQMAWYKKNLLDPYARAMNNISSERVSLAADYKALKKQLGIVPKNLRNKIEGEGFTKEQAVRMYIWNKQDMSVPGLSESDLADMVKYVESDANLQVFADQLIEINKGDGYPEPKDYWLAGSITTDLMNGLGGTKRAKHLEEWQQNVDAIFSEKNLNKLQAIHGKPYREALENMLQRMKSGKNRNYAGDSTTGRMMDWLNGSIGAIMFLNTRSAVLQTLSAVNFINFKDNNILAAGKAFANQPQYWKDFKELFNSDFLKERRDNAAITINESDIADMANKGGAKGAISYLLQKGFTPTQIADSFAIASGGATFYRNRIKSYIKQGMSEAEAKEKAFLDFRETAEESQQSSRPDRISKQQAGPLGRVVLAFANTPSQYARIIKKASQDLMAGRGDAKTNISKIIYYGAVQGFIFNAIQQALFAADLDDEDEKTEKMVRLGNGMADGVLRGMGVSGAAVAVVKNAGLRVYNESQKDRPKYEKVAFELTKLSPPIASKLSRINQAAREVQWNSDEMKQKGFSLDNPAWLAAGNVISATTNVPLDRVIKKVNNVNDALSQDLEMQERIALLAGWQSWELGIDKEEKENKTRSRSYRRSSGERKYIQRTRN